MHAKNYAEGNTKAHDWKSITEYSPELQSCIASHSAVDVTRGNALVHEKKRNIVTNKEICVERIVFIYV